MAIRQSAAVAWIFIVSVVSLAGQQGPPNYSELWRLYGELGQEAYVDGVVDGTFNAFMAARQGWLPSDEQIGTPDSPRVQAVVQKVFVMEQRPQIPAVMTLLYRDPANAYIPLIDMVFIARDRLAGQDVEPRLQQARREALESYRFMQQLEP